MMIRLGTIVMGADDVDRGVTFWSGVLGYEPVHFTDSENDFTILGAARVQWDSYPANPDFVVLADTEGNRFCVVDASHG